MQKQSEHNKFACIPGYQSKHEYTFVKKYATLLTHLPSISNDTSISNSNDTQCYIYQMVIIFHNTIMHTPRKQIPLINQKHTQKYDPACLMGVASTWIMSLPSNGISLSTLGQGAQRDHLHEIAPGWWRMADFFQHHNLIRTPAVSLTTAV